MRRIPRPTSSALALLPFLLVAGCSSEADAPPAAPPSSSAAQTTTLRLGSINAHNGQPSTEVARFIELVREASDGALEIEFVWTQDDGSDLAAADHKIERALVEAVSGGQLDLGITGTRVFATLGMDDLEYLNAPMLIDSPAVQQAVLESEDTIGLLAGLDAVGVRGLGYLPGDLRRPMSSAEPLVTPAAWEGVSIHVFDSVLPATAVSTLGGNPVLASGADRDNGLGDGSIQALENTLAFHTGRQSAAPYVPLNLVLWPNPTAVIGNPAALDALDDQAVGWLTQAAATVVAEGVDFGPSAEELENNCVVGARYVLASDDELAEMTEALAPVYAELESDPATAERLNRVRDLKATITPAPLTVPEACGSDAASPSADPDAAAALTGVFHGPDRTETDLVALGFPEDVAPHLAGYFVFAFDDGEFALSHAPGDGSGEQVACTGTYAVTGTQVAVDVVDMGGCGTVGRFLTADFAVDEDQLVLTNIVAAHPDDKTLFQDVPWTRAR